MLIILNPLLLSIFILNSKFWLAVVYYSSYHHFNSIYKERQGKKKGEKNFSMAELKA